MIGRVADRRDLSGVGFKQDWRWDRSARHALKSRPRLAGSCRDAWPRVLLDAERPVSWWVAYSLSSAEDMIGGEQVPRSWDQRHAASGGLAWDAGPWSLSAIATFHTGWPTTTLALATVPGPNGTEQVLVPGERNAERLQSLRRIDFRASRVFDAGVGCCVSSPR
jgi:hypothetical protein